jgi:hypothetical protein
MNCCVHRSLGSMPRAGRVSRLTLLSIVVSAACLTLLLWLKNHRPQLSLSVQPGIIKFGILGQNETHVRDFKLLNTGTRAIRVTGTQASCGCTTTSSLKGLELAPQAQHTASLTFKTGDAELEKLGHVTVFYSSLDSPHLTGWTELALTARVDPDYLVRPTFLDFGKVGDEDGSITKLVRMRPYKLSDVMVTSAKSTNSAFIIKQVAFADLPTELRTSAIGADPDTEAARDIYFLVTYNNAPVAANTIDETLLELKTNSNAVPVALIPAKADRSPRLTATPSALVVASASTGDVELSLALEAQSDCIVTAATATDPRIRLLTSLPTEKARRHKLLFLFADASPRTPMLARINTSITLANRPGEDAHLTIPAYRIYPSQDTRRAGESQ